MIRDTHLFHVCIDELARRSSVVNIGVAFAANRLSLWSYNDRNELAGSDRREGNDPGIPGDPVDDEQFAYDYDPIGNRTEYDVGVQDPSNTDYEANQLNQYLRAVTDDPSVAQGYRHDEDGNLIEAFVAADMNCDGALNSYDIDPFVLALTNPRLPRRLPGPVVRHSRDDRHLVIIDAPFTFNARSVSILAPHGPFSA